jgi:hypothetical protein
MHGSTGHGNGHKGHSDHTMVALESSLRDLGAGFHVFRDVPIGPGTVAFVVVGRCGVFTITPDCHAGTVTSATGELRLSGRIPEKDIVGQAYGEAMAVRNHLRALRGTDIPVQPLLVFTHAYVQVNGPVAGVRVLPVKWLAEALHSAPERLTDATCVNVATALRATPPVKKGAGGGAAHAGSGSSRRGLRSVFARPGDVA